jgi:hypothetical protein
MFQNTRWSGTEWRLGYTNHHGMKPKHIGRYIGKMQWLMPFIGFDWRYRKNGNGRNRRESFGQSSTKDKRAVLVPV